ncbi:MAG TPA: Ig-like domain-containing protein [Blastocatellia bacterium]|nr:Ig-like domain-containing protein [Blastocatellia bacterium]
MNKNAAALRRLAALILFFSVATALFLAARPTPVRSATTELFFSEYIEGSSNNKALEIYNGKGAAVNLATEGYNIQMFFNGSATAGLTINLTGTVADGDVYVVAQSAASPTILAQADQTNGSGWFNGDDAVVLRKGTTVIDVIGQVGFDPGTEWGSGLTSTADNTLRRKSSVCAGDANGGDAFDPTVEWDGFATDTFDGLGSHTAACGSDFPPSVTSTTPVNGATGVAVEANITITFSEPVNVTGAWFSISGSTTGAHTALVGGGPTTFTLNPDADFAFGESVTATVFAGQVTDQDATDPPDSMQSNFIWSFSIEAAPIPIHSIQGNGSASPLAGMALSTTGIVTGRKSNGFFIQEPDADADADPTTSEGIFVFTSSAPPASATIGNLVKVAGTVQEFIPSADPNSPPLTEIAGSPTVTLISAGNQLPVPITLTAADTDPAGSIEQLEKFEGMRVFVASLTVVAPTQGSVDENDAIGLSNGVFYGVITGLARPFREPGIESPNPLPPGSPCCVPRFDANPERLRVDSDGQPGAATLEVTTGASIADLVGPLDYGFRTYTILPDVGTLTQLDVIGNISAVPLPLPCPGEFTVASANMQRFFDTVNDPDVSDVALTPTAFNSRLNKASLAIRNIMRSPDIIAVSEVENLPTLQAMANKVNGDAVAAGDPSPNYQAYLEEGNDIGGIDVGFLVKSVRVTVIDVTQEGKSATYIDPSTNSPALLNDRPPLILRATIQPPAGSPFAVTVIANHLRSLNGVDDPADGNRVRTKRLAQAEFLANLIQARQAANPSERIISVGDYNAFQFNDGLVDVIGSIKGNPTPFDEVVLAGSDLVDPDLVDLVDLAPASQRYSFLFDGNAQELDHILITGNLLSRINGLRYARNNADFPESYRSDPTRPERISDHDILLGYFQLPLAITGASVDKAVLWTPNHKLVDVAVNYTVANGCGPVNCTLSVTSNEPVNGTDDGDTAPDWEIVDAHHVKLRAERSGIGNGRIYTITITCTDDKGNATRATVTVSVPLSQR